MCDMTSPAKAPRCPTCGSESIKLISSRDLYPPNDTHHRRPPTAIAKTYECQCGCVFVLTVKHDEQQQDE
jgi:hypothetical protein